MDRAWLTAWWTASVRAASSILLGSSIEKVSESMRAAFPAAVVDGVEDRARRREVAQLGRERVRHLVAGDRSRPASYCGWIEHVRGLDVPGRHAALSEHGRHGRGLGVVVHQRRLGTGIGDVDVHRHGQEVRRGRGVPRSLHRELRHRAAHTPTAAGAADAAVSTPRPPTRGPRPPTASAAVMPIDPRLPHHPLLHRRRPSPGARRASGWMRPTAPPPVQTHEAGGIVPARRSMPRDHPDVPVLQR